MRDLSGPEGIGSEQNRGGLLGDLFAELLEQEATQEEAAAELSGGENGASADDPPADGWSLFDEPARPAFAPTADELLAALSATVPEQAPEAIGGSVEGAEPLAEPSGLSSLSGALESTAEDGVEAVAADTLPGEPAATAEDASGEIYAAPAKEPVSVASAEVLETLAASPAPPAPIRRTDALMPPEPLVVRATPPKHQLEPAPASEALSSLVTDIDRAVVHELNLGTREAAAQAPRPLRREDGCILFSLDGAGYALPIQSVSEIDTVPKITPVPNVPPAIRGVANMRGEVLPVLDLRLLLGIKPAEQLYRGRVMVIRTPDREQTAVVVVDEVRGTADLPLSGLQAPKGVGDRVASLLHGVGTLHDRIVNVVDVEKLLAAQEVRPL